MNKNNPIGIFDSGVGGLSVWKELTRELPNESVIYYADNANFPYGPKNKQQIKKISSGIVDFLIRKNCKIIIVACNTATAAAIDFLREKYSLPFIGMEPAVKPAALNTKTRSIAVLATKGTFNGRLYNETSKKYAKDVLLNIKVGDKLVDIVENGLVYQESTKTYLEGLLKPLLDKNIDHLVLGCTHYPFLIDIIKKIVPQNLKIIDPAPAVIRQTKKILKQHNLLNNKSSQPEYEFYTSGKFDILEKFVKEITTKKYTIAEV